MATLLPPEGFLSGSFRGLHPHAAGITSAMPCDCGDGPQLRRPCSPPQPVPRRQRGSGGAEAWEDAVVRVASSPASSDATEHFFDTYSEVPSAASSLGEDGGSAAEEVISRALPPSVEAQPSATPAPQAGANGGGTLASWQQERSQRLAAEAAAAELQRQLDDVAAVLFGARRPSGNGSEPPVAETLRAVLAEAAGEAARQQQRADEAAQHAADAAYVARLVAGVCARAATAADLQALWADERALLERRLEQAARMGQAMLKHQKEHGAEPEPWRQQLLSTAFAVGCSLLGGAAAVLIISRTQA